MTNTLPMDYNSCGPVADEALSRLQLILQPHPSSGHSLTQGGALVSRERFKRANFVSFLTGEYSQFLSAEFFFLIMDIFVQSFVTGLGGGLINSSYAWGPIKMTGNLKIGLTPSTSAVPLAQVPPTPWNHLGHHLDSCTDSSREHQDRDTRVRSACVHYRHNVGGMELVRWCTWPTLNSHRRRFATNASTGASRKKKSKKHLRQIK